MKIKTNSSKKFFNDDNNNLKLVDNYYSRKNGPIVQISLENKNKKKKIKPPFKQGLYSYKQSFNTFQNEYNQKLLNNNFFSNSPNKYKKENNIMNNIGIIQPIGQNISNNNSSLSFSSINLNKYKINSNPNQKNKITFNNNNFNTNRNSNNNNDNINIKKTKTNISLNFHKDINNIHSNIFGNINNNNINNNNHINSNINTNSKKIYYNYFKENPSFEKESRRMIIELIKIINNQNYNTNNNNINVKQILTDNNISLKVLNQKYNEIDTNYNYSNNNNKELFGEAKKQLYLKNLNYSLSYDSLRSNNNEDSLNNKSNTNINNIINVDNLNNLLLTKEKKKINILNFLCVPRVLNLIEEDKSQKYIFLITLDEIYFKEGKESYYLQWRDMENNTIKNEFNLKEIKSCKINRKNKNRFIIEMDKDDLIENLSYEIETPNEEICNNYVIGINYLI